MPIHKIEAVFSQKEVRAVFDLLFRNPFRRWFLIVLVILNVLGSVYGYYWYSGQLKVTPVYLWLFTFDSPFSATLFALAMIGFLMGYNNKLLQLIAYTGVIKFGIWASVVIVDFWIAGGTPTLIVVFLLLSHLGMALEGWIFIRHLYVPPGYIVLLALWFGVGDYLDYVVGIHPYLYYSGQFMVAAVTAVALSILLLVYVWITRIERHRFIFRK